MDKHDNQGNAHIVELIMLDGVIIKYITIIVHKMVKWY